MSFLSQNNLIREDERRGASHEDNDEIESKKRSLFSFSSFGGIGGIGGHGGGGGRHHHHHHQQPQQPSGFYILASVLCASNDSNRLF